MRKLVCFLTLLIFAACTTVSTNKRVSSDSISIDTSTVTNFNKQIFVPEFSIVGDFNADKITDTIYESYISSITNRATTKVKDSTDLENNIELVIKSKPITRLYTSITGIDTFIVTKEAQQTGLYHFRNLGDLNGDGGDEIGYSIDWADFSNFNSYYILTLKGNKLEQLFTFHINEGLLYDGFDGVFENNEPIKPNGTKSFFYKFYSDSATVEVGEFKF